MNSEQYELFISLLMGEIERLRPKLSEINPKAWKALTDEQIRDHSNTVWKKLKRDKKTGQFQKRIKR